MIIRYEKVQKCGNFMPSKIFLNEYSGYRQIIDLKQSSFEIDDIFDHVFFYFDHFMLVCYVKRLIYLAVSNLVSMLPRKDI